jgi:predicted amidohydrolase
MADPYRAAAIQFDVTSREPERNVDRASEIIRRTHADHDIRIACLPEMFTTGYDWPILMASAEPIPGPTTHSFSDLCSELGIWVVTGSIPERRGGDVFNTSVLIGPDGAIHGQYSKVHLFTVLNEDDHIRAGDRISVVESPIGTIGLTVCYDLRFCELYRRICLDGAEIVFVPAAWPNPRLVHWQTLLQARAIENQYFVVGNNRAGRDHDVVYAGGSMIVSPWGEILASADDQETVLVAEIDSAAVEDARDRIPSIRDRRPDCYELDQASRQSV